MPTIYVNRTPNTKTIFAGRYRFEFPPGDYYRNVDELAEAVANGSLVALDQAAYLSQNPTALVANLYTLNPAVDLATEATLATKASQASVNTKASQVSVDTKASQASVDTLQAEVEVAEVHMHSYERWACAHAVPVGEVTIAAFDDWPTHNLPFATTGSAVAFTFGDWVQVLGSGDTPVIAGKAYFDFHRIFVQTAQFNLYWRVQFAFGETADGAVLAGDYTEFFYWNNVLTRQIPVVIQTKRLPVGTKVWARSATDAGGVVAFDFYYGIHEYGS